MAHSARCPDLTTYWNRNAAKCEPCKLKPGYEVTPNCGYDDYGGRHESPFKKCLGNTFNDGSRALCEPCTPCPPGYKLVRPCNPTTDNHCQEQRSGTTEVATTKPATSVHVSAFVNKTPTIATDPLTVTIPSTQNSETPANSAVLWTVPLAVLISITLVLLSVCIIYIKRKRGQHSVLTYRRRSSFINEGFSPLPAPACKNDLEIMLSPEILSEPLPTVLNNLDVLEELVILLDPDSNVVKTTKHLASLCSFPSTWITYTYSMKDTKSPLKAMLEGVTSKHPDWTVGHLAKLLRQIERNDAIAVLAQLRPR
ncbi:IGF-like family receptor 1 isoform X2 [Toxotes jaculatrix]|uniref:IGF-like family receptor 1 isoform X2 n=1 Tax=Toxotes jaculatrix TaxID=941984 RepID=UPI001B3AD4CD|nr:IGF-like family receptor 1 isoform X2 [Toxotes jaculatrix]